MNIIDIASNAEIIFALQLILAATLGALIGVEREYIGKAAGMRTFSLVTLGSTIFTILSKQGFFMDNYNLDPSRVASGIVIGIGFLGTGIIIFRDSHVEGLTTAAALWAAGAIGMAIGCGYYTLAVIGAVLIIVVLTVAKKVNIEEKRGA